MCVTISAEREAYDKKTKTLLPFNRAPDAIMTPMPNNVIGLDIGGANLKAASADGSARSMPFELWKYPDRLGVALRELLSDGAPDRLAVTMTGELCDCYRTKRDGVDRILAEVELAFPGVPIDVWSTAGIFVAPDEARRDYLKVAASNWHALATFAGEKFPNNCALMIDVGTTTSDIIPIREGRPVPLGRTDFERLRARELVYTGIKRTPICALAIAGLMAELFATTQDVYLRLGLAAEDPDDHLTADGRPATAENAHARLSRMLGGDSEITPLEETDRLAHEVFQRQRTLLVEAIVVVTARLSEPPQAVLLFGSGEFLARAAWGDFLELQEKKRNPIAPEVISLADLLGPTISAAACAYAVAVLRARI